MIPALLTSREGGDTSKPASGARTESASSADLEGPLPGVAVTLAE